MMCESAFRPVKLLKWSADCISVSNPWVPGEFEKGPSHYRTSRRLSLYATFPTHMTRALTLNRAGPCGRDKSNRQSFLYHSIQIDGRNLASKLPPDQYYLHQRLAEVLVQHGRCITGSKVSLKSDGRSDVQMRNRSWHFVGSGTSLKEGIKAYLFHVNDVRNAGDPSAALPDCWLTLI